MEYNDQKQFRASEVRLWTINYVNYYIIDSTVQFSIGNGNGGWMFVKFSILE